ncbi:hypothetical protein QQF64_017997 [Cirrhinus molitorella]|uniref:G-protein coupled receptors family 1 profile domain-containing protein n=1 Tax=Cirrhinus molitorella TaxID=172907 RepID=A0ABR3LNN3_9TELE
MTNTEKMNNSAVNLTTPETSTDCITDFLWLLEGTGGGVALEFFNLNLSVCEIGLVFTGRPLFQCLICVERYLAVVHPVTFLKYKPLRYRFLLALSIQLFCLVAVLRALKQSGPGERRRERMEENPMKRRAFHLILISTSSENSHKTKQLDREED